MGVDRLSNALQSLHSDRPDVIGEGLEHLRAGMGSLAEADFRRAVEELCALYYVDTADRPDLQPLLGLPALRRVIATEDPYSRSFALFAVGKIHDPAVREALPEVIGSLMHPDKEVRDSAARTLGKIAERVPASQMRRTAAPRCTKCSSASCRRAGRPRAGVLIRGICGSPESPARGRRAQGGVREGEPTSTADTWSGPRSAPSTGSCSHEPPRTPRSPGSRRTWPRRTPEPRQRHPVKHGVDCAVLGPRS